MKHSLALVIALGLISNALGADDKINLTNEQQRISYALGMSVVRGLKVDDFNIDMKTIAAGMADMQAGKPAYTPEQVKMVMKEMQDDTLARAVAKKEAAGEIHRKEGAAFLAANAKKDGVKIKEVVAPDGSKAELQYKILHSGPAGPSPKKSDTVVVRYRGTLIDGTVFDIFDPAMKHGDTAIFKMNDVIPGWAEALQMMKPGDKWQLFVPPSLAYADYGPPEIGMYTTLVYELELVNFSPTDERASAPTQ
ncbi:MAG TPA: FKBP-type peptidyl-prolyl cis-trans isomerase [Verrucomicrobiae bacterium]|nr:FKBP-type peptidyl-prolyl cis-trans isomerase [Verrucomicrobiae bacterium]